MKPYTYYDYLKYKKICNNFKLNDQTESYKFDKEIRQPHDKTYKTILSNKKEASLFINDALELKDFEKLNSDMLIHYNKSFITKNFENKEADIVYKLKDRNIFFLIEHQSTIDYQMPFRITSYASLIILSAIDKKQLNKKEYKIPAVYSIVLYTGKKKWDANKYLEECQERLKSCDISRFSTYKVVDINNYSKEELLKKHGVLSKSLCLDKVEKREEFEDVLKQIMKIRFNEEELEILVNIIYYSLSKKIGLEKAKKYIEEIKNVGGEYIMLEAVIEDILREQRENYQKGVQEGKREGKREGKKEEKIKIIEKMVRNKFDDNTIIAMVSINKIELEKIKKDIKL